MWAAYANDLAVGEDELERRDVIGGYAVSEGVWASGVFGDVTPDGAGFLAGRIGSKVQAGVLDGTSQVEIDDSGLYDGALIFEVEFEDTVHAGEGQHEAATASECAAREARSSAAADDRNAVLRGEFNDSGNLICGGGKHDGVGPAFFDRAIVFVKQHVFRKVEDRGWAEKFFQLASQNLRHKHRSFSSPKFTIESVALSAQHCAVMGGAKPVLV